MADPPPLKHPTGQPSLMSLFETEPGEPTNITTLPATLVPLSDPHPAAGASQYVHAPPPHTLASSTKPAAQPGALMPHELRSQLPCLLPVVLPVQRPAPHLQPALGQTLASAQASTAAPASGQQAPGVASHPTGAAGTQDRLRTIEAAVAPARQPGSVQTTSQPSLHQPDSMPGVSLTSNPSPSLALVPTRRITIHQF